MSEIVGVEIRPVVLPLVAPFQVATRTAYEARNVLVQVVAADGTIGVGAAAPVSYVTGEDAATVIASVSAAAEALIGLDASRIGPMLSAAAERVPPEHPAALAAIEMALYDLWARAWHVPLWCHFGGTQTELTTDVTVPIVTPDVAADRAAARFRAGFRNLKVKVGDAAGVDADLERIRAIARAAPGARLRIDANQAFTPPGAVAFAQQLLAITAQVDLIEQPVPKEDVDGLRYVRQRLGGLPLFADEGARTVDSVIQLIRSDAVDGINVKLMKHGISGALTIGTVCRAHGVRLMIGCMLESRVSLSAACAIAAGTGWFEFVDLDAHLLVSDTAFLAGGLDSDEARMSPDTRGMGWGVSVAAGGWNNSGDAAVTTVGAPGLPGQRQIANEP